VTTYWDFCSLCKAVEVHGGNYVMDDYSEDIYKHFTEEEEILVITFLF
jgi:hypothetical protein